MLWTTLCAFCFTGHPDAVAGELLSLAQQRVPSSSRCSMHQFSVARYLLRHSSLCEVVQSLFLALSPWSSPVAASLPPPGRTCGLFSVVVPAGQPAAVTLPGMTGWQMQSPRSGGSLGPHSTRALGPPGSHWPGPGPLSALPRCLQDGIILLAPAVAQVLPRTVKELDSEKLTFVIN